MTCNYYIPTYTTATTMREINEVRPLYAIPDDWGESVPSDEDMVGVGDTVAAVDPPDGANPMPFCNTTH